MLKLRKVDLLGFKSFCEKTHITFSGGGVTCIVGPNGCGKSNIVDAISWVLGEQSHKMLRAERMSDCIFNGTAKRPPLGLAEVSLTLVDPELAEAAAKVLESVEKESSLAPSPESPLMPATEASRFDATIEAGSTESPATGAPWKNRAAEKPAIAVKPGEVLIGRRLYRSGQSEYLMNGRVVRLRDVQELFMGLGLGPDSYAIIEQGRIGQILNSKPMDRRAIIEEAAGVTVYKTKRRLAEAKLEASKLNLARVNDILVEVEKQLGSLKRQASKARRYAELREEMRGLLRSVLASKARQLEREAERLEKALRELAETEARELAALRELEAEQGRLNARGYELETELRHTQNFLGQCALELDRAENRITFHQEQDIQEEARSKALTREIARAEAELAEIQCRLEEHREAIDKLRAEASRGETALRESAARADSKTLELASLEARIEELRQVAGRLGEAAVREQAEALQAQDLLSRLAAELAEQESERLRLATASAAQADAAQAAETRHTKAVENARELERAVREAHAQLADGRRCQQDAQRAFERTREELSSARACRSSLEQILNDRAYSAEAVKKLFDANGEGNARGFRAAGVLADYAEVVEAYEGAIEQFLREELEYVVVETFDHARAGIALLREEVGGRATFFVDSLRHFKAEPAGDSAALPEGDGIVSRLDQLIEFRDPLGPAAKQFIPKLRSAYLVETAAAAEQLARTNPRHYYLTLDGTCYHGRMVTGGRPGDAGPLALKRELRMHEAEAARLERAAAQTQAELSKIEEQLREIEAQIERKTVEHVEAEKSAVAAAHLAEQERAELARFEQQLAERAQKIARLNSQAEGAQRRVEDALRHRSEAENDRAAAEREAVQAAQRLAAMRHELQTGQEELSSRREELAAMAERLASAETIEMRLADEASHSSERAAALKPQLTSLAREKMEREASTAELARQMENSRNEKARLEQRRAQLEQGWEASRARLGELDDALRCRRQALDELRGVRGQREIEKARNDSDRDHLQQTCTEEVRAQPEELIALEQSLLAGEELSAAETAYAGMKSRVEAMGPVNMMALEEFQECEQRHSFLARERDDLVQSIENTQQAIAELDQTSRQKFEAAFRAINAHFAEAFQALFGGGTGEMRLTEPDSSGECGLDIVAQPPGKRLQNVLLLSGGEKALTALALLIAVFRYQPSPFCVLDEVDAPLDDANVHRFNKMLVQMGEKTQFIIVTHNRKTMEMGSVLYGVTMQEPGVSKIVSVRWDDSEPQSSSHAA